jgi:hypothetical protein
MPTAELSTTGLVVVDTSLSNDTGIYLPTYESTLIGHSFIVKNLQNWITVGLSNGTYINETSSASIYYRTNRVTGWNILGPYPGATVNAEDGLSTSINYLAGGTIFNYLTTDTLYIGDERFYVSSGFINASVNQVVFDFSQLTDGVSTSFLTVQELSTVVVSSASLTVVPDISTLSLSTGTATFSTITTDQGVVSLSSSWLLYAGQGLQQFTSTVVRRDNYRIQSLIVSSATFANSLCNQPNILSTLSIAFTQADQTFYPSSQTTLLQADTSLFPGVIELPPASSVTGYFFTVQDLANSFQTNPLTLSTIGLDLFFPILSPICNVTSKNLTLVATTDNLWRTVQEYQQSSFYTFQPTTQQTSSFVTSSLALANLIAPTMCQMQSFTFAP